MTLIVLSLFLIFCSYEFLVVGNQIVKITQNKEETELKVESLEIMGRLTYRTVFKREAPLSDFTACSDGSRCVISYFNGFGRPPKFNACDTTDWKVSTIIKGMKLDFTMW